MTLDDDIRWRRLHQGAPCSCGSHHDSMIDIIIDWPAGWKHGGGLRIRPNSELRMEGDFLSEDFCVIEGKYFAIHTVLEIPVIGAPAPFSFIVWSSLTSTDFATYVQASIRGGAAGHGRAFSRLMNSINGYPDTYAMKTALQAVGGFRRPKTILEDADHPLVTDQRQGINLDRLFELYAANGHEMRPALVSN